MQKMITGTFANMSNCFSKLVVGRGSWIHNTFLQRKCTPDLNLYFGMAIECVPACGHKEVCTINDSKIKIPVDMQYQGNSTKASSTFQY
jgi:hypothetical protein